MWTVQFFVCCLLPRIIETYQYIRGLANILQNYLYMRVLCTVYITQKTVKLRHIISKETCGYSQALQLIYPNMLLDLAEESKRVN